MALLFAAGTAILITIALYSLNAIPDAIEAWLDRQIADSKWW